MRRINSIANGMRSMVFTMICLILFSSCEKVIQIDLNEADPRLVVDGNITNLPGPDTIRLGLTGNYFGPNRFDEAAGAVVTISDSEGNNEILTEVEPGVYVLYSIDGVPGRTYFLEVEYEGQVYEASATMLSPASLGPITVEYRDGSELFFREGYYLNLKFQDLQPQQYYQLRVFRNGEVINLGGGFVTFEGSAMVNQSEFVYNRRYEPGDTSMVKLVTFDRTSYDYFITLEDATGSGGFGNVPQNPSTNISNEGLGFFGAFAIDSVQFVIQ